MARKIKTTIKCPVCKKEFETFYYTIRQGIMQGIRVLDNSFCSDECEDKFNALLNEETK